MGETTIQPANQAAGHPGNKPTDHPPKKKRHASTWIALASAATAVAAAVLAGFQVNVASTQNTVAEQEQLVSLTSLIGQQLTQQNKPATNTLKGVAGTEAAAVTTQGELAQLTVEGQAAAVLIHDLNGVGIAGIEYVEVGRALQATGDTAEAISYYNDALTAPQDDRTTRATALRYLGNVYYGLGRNVIAHQDFMRATKAYSRDFLDTKDYVANGIAESYLGDAGHQLLIKGCRIALADIVAARRVMGSYSENTTNQALVKLEAKVAPLQCASAG